MQRRWVVSWRIGDEVHDVKAQALGEGRWRVTLDGRAIEVTARVGGDGGLVIEREGGVLRAAVTRLGDERWVSAGGRTLMAKVAAGKRRGAGEHGASLEAPMPGKVTRVLVALGDRVKKGDPVITLEAMKMEHTLKAPRDGVVRELRATLGELVQPGVALVALEEP